MPRNAPPAWVAPLAGERSGGLVDVDPETSRTGHLPRVWSLGDVANVRAVVAVPFLAPDVHHRVVDGRDQEVQSITFVLYFDLRCERGIDRRVLGRHWHIADTGPRATL